MDKNAKPKQLIGSLTKGLLILEMMMEKDSLGVTEISKVLGVNKSSAYRLLITLDDRNFVRQDPVSGKYSLGMRLASFRTKVLEGIDLRGIARPYLKWLTDETREASALCVLSDNSRGDNRREAVEQGEHKRLPLRRDDRTSALHRAGESSFRTSSRRPPDRIAEQEFRAVYSVHHYR